MIKTSKLWKAVKRMEKMSVTAVVWRACIAGRPMLHPKPNMIDMAIINDCFRFVMSCFASKQQITKKTKNQKLQHTDAIYSNPCHEVCCIKYIQSIGVSHYYIHRKANHLRQGY